MTDKKMYFHSAGASVRDGDVVTRVFGWPREGGHVWEIVGSGDRATRRDVV